MMKLINETWCPISERVGRWDDATRPVQLFKVSLKSKKRKRVCIVAIDSLSEEMIGMGLRDKKRSTIILERRFESKVLRKMVGKQLGR